MSHDPAETTTTERLEALADADFDEKVRAELRRLREDHRQFQVTLIRAEEQVRKYNNLLDTLHAFADANSSDEAWDALEYVGKKAIAAVETVHEAERDLHHAAVAISCLERNGYSDYPRVSLAMLEEDAPF